MSSPSLKPDAARWYADFRALCRQHVPAAVECLAKAIARGDKEAARILLEHAWGKPAQARGEPGENSAVTEVVYSWAAPAEKPDAGS